MGEDIVCRMCAGTQQIQKIIDPEDGAWTWEDCPYCKHGLESRMRRPIRPSTNGKAIDAAIKTIENSFRTKK